MSEAYYMTLVESVAAGYYMEPVKSVRDAYYMTPVDVPSSDTVWTHLRIVALNSENWGSVYVNPEVILTIGGEYSRVLLVGRSGSWDDGGASPPDWRGFCVAATETDYGFVGPSGSFYTAEEAENAFVGSSLILGIGDNREVYLVIPDIDGLNTGVLTLDVYAS